MKRLLLMGVLCALGCKNLAGPGTPRSPVRVDDPGLSIEEQQRLGRDRLSLPQPNSALLPPSGAARPGEQTQR